MVEISTRTFRQWIAIFLVVMSLASSGLSAVAAAPTVFRADIRWTPYGVPHIQAADYAGLGYGVAYAQVPARICELYDRVLTTSGKRAFYLGTGDNDANVNSDLYHAWLRTKVSEWLGGPAGDIDTPSIQARALMRGWVAGINRYLREIGGANGISDPKCKGAAWIRPLTEMDGWVHVATYSGQSHVTNTQAIAAAAPPSSALTSCEVLEEASLRPRQPPAASPDVPSRPTFGSNAYVFGRSGTKNGRGALLANPHWYWKGSHRYFNLHMKIPGQLDAIGTTRDLMPFVWVGHNQTLAWARTVATSARYGYWRLTLDPKDPTRYLYDGVYRPMRTTCVSTEVRQSDGSIQISSQPVYETVWGPMVRTRDLPWDRGHAYAFRSAIADTAGLRVVDQHLKIMATENVRDLAAVLNRYGAVAGNTMAADAEGGTFGGDIGGVPGVSPAQLRPIAEGGCLDPVIGDEKWRKDGIAVLDGSRSACAWRTDPGAPAGLAGLATSPHLFRDDYIANSNQSYWLMNPRAKLENFSRIFGQERVNIGLRAQVAIDMAEGRLAGSDGLGSPGADLESLKAMMFENRVLSAERARDALVRRCQAVGYTWKNVNLGKACAVLSTWDMRYNTGSRGAAIWRQFMYNHGLIFAVSFDPANPLVTPNGLKVDDPRVMDALAQAVENLRANHIPLDVPLQRVSGVRRQGEWIPIHGGADEDGVFNVIEYKPLQRNIGWIVDEYGTGSSYIMATVFTDHGPISDDILVYSQSDNVKSSHYKDMTKLYSKYMWIRQAYRDEDVIKSTVKASTIIE